MASLDGLEMTTDEYSNVEQYFWDMCPVSQTGHIKIEGGK